MDIREYENLKADLYEAWNYIQDIIDKYRTELDFLLIASESIKEKMDNLKRKQEEKE